MRHAPRARRRSDGRCRFVGMRTRCDGRSAPEIVARCKAMGCTDVLLKPVPARTLLARAREWLGEGAAEGGTSRKG